MNGGIGWNLSILGVSSDVPVSRNSYQTVSDLYEDLYKIKNVYKLKMKNY